MKMKHGVGEPGVALLAVGILAMLVLVRCLCDDKLSPRRASFVSYPPFAPGVGGPYSRLRQDALVLQRQEEEGVSGSYAHPDLS